MSYLAERDPLIVLDNCEHVIEASAELADALLASSQVAIMATSREIFDMPGEWVWRLEPLDAKDARRFSSNEHAPGGQVHAGRAGRRDDHSYL